jgi:YHS domain-containing protein
MKSLLVLAAFCFAMPSFAMADTSKPAAKPAAITCPVTGEKIASPKDAYNSEVYKGKTYYFCCAGCKPMFDKDPAKYIKGTAKSSSN